MRSTRRDAMKVIAAGGGLIVGFGLPGPSAARILSTLDSNADAARLHAFIRIDAESNVTIVCGKSEMGQGALTGFAQVVADELDCAWEQVTVAPSPVHPDYGNPPKGFMSTGGSTTIRLNWMRMRQAGAAARLMLRQAAAAKWQVPLDQVTTAAGIISGPRNRRATYGAFAAAAAKLPAPADVTLKAPGSRTFIGKSLKRVDTAAKVDGTAKFGIDVNLPGMVTAVMAFPPDLGGTAQQVEDSAALKVPGVRQIVRTKAGIAVVADHYWAAVAGRKALKITWQPGPHANTGINEVRASFRKALDSKGKAAVTRGSAIPSASGKALTAVYEQPFLAHACMEPMNCTIHVKGDSADVWVPTQSQMVAQRTVAAITGIAAAKVRIHTTLLGGGFGRRSAQDFVRTAAEIAKVVKAPVRLVYSREDDMRAWHYRPFNMTRVKAQLAEDKSLASLNIRVAVPSVAKWTGFRFLVRPDGIDSQAVEGFHGMPYAVPNLHVEWVEHDLDMPVWFWRAVGASHNPFALESAIDEAAHAAGQDPYRFRRAMLGGKPRHRAVLDMAAAEAGWSRPPKNDRARGIALVESFGSICAQVAEIRREDDEIKVERVTCVIDCGLAINPQQIVAQMESNIAYGLSALLYGEITLDKGRVVQENFDSYQPIRIDEMPKVDVHIIEGADRPGGVGEPGLPPLLPAVANAVYALTGVRHRKLPLYGES